MSVSGTASVAVAQVARPRPLTIVAYVLAILASAGFAIGAWLPWVEGIYPVSLPTASSAILLHPFSAAPWQSLEPRRWLWGAISAAGLVLCPLLLTRSRAVTLMARVMFLIWALMAGGIAWIFIPHPGTAGSQFRVSAQWQVGFYVSTISLALALIAGILLLASGLPPKQSGGARFRGEQIVGTGTLLLAALIWAAGVYAMPWATLNCRSVPLVLATCTGLPFNAALNVGISHYVSMSSFTLTLDSEIARDALPILLGAGALLLVLALARAGASRPLCAWATAWLLLATGCALLANVGVAEVVAYYTGAPAGMPLPVLPLQLPPGQWNGDAGILVTFVGLLALWIIVLVLWVVAFRPSRTNVVS